MTDATDELGERVQQTLTGEVRETTLVNMASEGRKGVTPVDRSTRFGNPFHLKKDGGDYTRAESVDAYRDWFREKVEEDPEFRAAVEDLRGETLGCWCRPKACHGDIILEYLRGEMDV